MASEGVIEYSWGSYHGQVKAGKAEGCGVLTCKNGDRYEGAFANDKMHGAGVYAWPDGHRYEGEWVDDERHGTGVYAWKDGERYEGGFVDGNFHGRGVYWLDGARIFDGEWSKDFALRGTAVEADGAFFLAELDGKTSLFADKGFEDKKGKWTLVGRVEGWRGRRRRTGGGRRWRRCRSRGSCW